MSFIALVVKFAFDFIGSTYEHCRKHCHSDTGLTNYFDPTQKLCLNGPKRSNNFLLLSKNLSPAQQQLQVCNCHLAHCQCMLLSPEYFLAFDMVKRQAFISGLVSNSLRVCLLVQLGQIFSSLNSHPSSVLLDKVSRGCREAMMYSL